MQSSVTDLLEVPSRSVLLGYIWWAAAGMRMWQGWEVVEERHAGCLEEGKGVERGGGYSFPRR